MKQVISIFFWLAIAITGAAQPLRLQFSDEQAAASDTVCISLVANNFDTVGSFQFSIHWDTAGLKYLRLEQKDIPGLVGVGETEAGAGVLRLSWFDPLGEGVTLPDGTVLLDLCFLAKACEGGSFELAINDDPLPIEVYRIDEGEPLNIGLEAEDGEVEVFPKDLIELGNDTFLCPGMALILDASCDGCAYAWSDGSTAATFEPTEEGTFSVTVTDPNGCVETDSVEIVPPAENPLDIVLIVNVITPNGDGLNDALVFRRLEKYPNNRLIVFNRWGGEVYRSNDYQNNWTGEHRGKPLPAGVYFYELTISNGQNQFEVKNALTIIRE